MQGCQLGIFEARFWNSGFLMHLFFLKINRNSLQKCSTRAQTSVPWQAHSCICALTPKKCGHRTFTQQTFNTIWIFVLQVGLVKLRFRHHRTGHNNQRLNHDATITSIAAQLANSTPFIPVVLNHRSESHMRLLSTLCVALCNLSTKPLIFCATDFVLQ